MRCRHAMHEIVESKTDQHTERNSGLRAHFDACASSLLRLLSARLGNRSDAEDLLQDMWLRLASADTGPIANPPAYLHRMALNLANDLVREQIRRRGREAAWSDVMIAEHGADAIDPSPSPEQALLGRRELEQVQTALLTLPDRAGEVFRRHRLEGHSHAEVASAMGISRSAVEKHMATAIKYLLRALKNEDET